MAEGRRWGRSGFTLIETMVVAAVFGLLVLWGIPRISNSVVRGSLRSARTQFTGLYQRARSAAIETGRAAAVSRNPATGVLVATASPRFTATGVGAPNTADTIGRPVNFSTELLVSVTFSAGDTLKIDPRGLANSGTTTVRFTRQGMSDSVIVSGFGRISR